MDTSALNLSKNADISCFEFGNESQPILKADNFMLGAEQLKAHAVAGNQFGVADSFYPGVRMAISPIYTKALLHHFQLEIEKIFKLKLSSVKKAISRYSIVTFPPSTLKTFQQIPHFDAATKKSLAVLHYLCDDENSGTAFYRHRESGFEFIDQARREPYLSCISRQFPEDSNQGYIVDTTEEFEKVCGFSAVFNRLLLYRASSLHSGIIGPDYNFDPSPSTGRLTITSFIEFEEFV